MLLLRGFAAMFAGTSISRVRLISLPLCESDDAAARYFFTFITVTSLLPDTRAAFSHSTRGDMFDVSFMPPPYAYVDADI